MEAKCVEEERRRKIKTEEFNMKCTKPKKELSVMEKSPGKLIGNIHNFFRS